MANKKCPECVKGAAKWMATFSDMMTLLLTFFVLLLTMATFEKAKISQTFGIISGAMGIMQNQSPTPMSELNIVSRTSMKDSSTTSEENTQEKIKSMSETQHMEQLISITKTEKGLSVRIMDSALFRSGSAELLPEAYPIIEKLVNIIKDTPYYINIEGHTDDLGSPDMNWTLSTNRALSVVRQFIKDGLNPVRTSASGYGQYHPIFPNITEENRARNRRVEINLVTPEFAESGKANFDAPAVR